MSMNIERIEALVKKYVNDFFLPSVANAQILRNALTEQAETHAGELKAYDHMNQHLVREVEIMNERIRQLEAERVPTKMGILFITNAYESGIGHAFDELCNPYMDDTDGAIAYELGKEFGKRRGIGKPAAPQQKEGA